MSDIDRRVKWSKFAAFKKDNSPATGYLEQAMSFAVGGLPSDFEDIIKARNILRAARMHTLVAHLDRAAEARGYTADDLADG